MTPANISKLEGLRFGKLEVISIDGRSKNGHTKWLCICDCGSLISIRADSLKRNKLPSCGCWALDQEKNRNRDYQTKHGLSKTGAASSWMQMMDRCFNKNSKDYKRYGGSGITVCSNLSKSPKNLINTIGDRKKNSGISIDRINNNEGYYCGDCSECLEKNRKRNIRWADVKTQTRNQSRSIWISINGVSKHFLDWCDFFNVNKNSAYSRRRRGKQGINIFL
jgi:hypothetical protein